MDKDYTLIANFVRDSFNLVLKSNPEEAGSVAGSGRFDCNEYALYGVTPNVCYTFINWTDEETGKIVSTKLTDTILMDKDYTLIANFIRDSFNLVLKSNPEDAGTVAGEGHFDCNENALYTAVPNECYTFINWTDAETGDTLSFNSGQMPDINTILMDKDYTLIANFVRDSFNLVLKSNPENAGTLIGEGRYACGDTIDIEAIAKEYFNFSSWTDTLEKIISHQPTHKIIIKSDSVLIANFYDIEINVVVRWDSVLNATPGDTVSLNAYIENIDLPISFSKIDFNIGMDYKLFYPLKLYFVENNIEYPLAFTYKFADGINATIIGSIICASTIFSSPQKILRLEGMTLMSHTTKTPVFFNTFNITAPQLYSLTLLDGLLDVSKYCGSEWRGAMTFLPDYEVEMNNIVVQNILEMDFTSEGEVLIRIEIIDIDGNIILTEKLNLQKGTQTELLQLHNISSGKYFIKFTNPLDYSITMQFIIVR
jgi:hypothetical protein